MDTTNLQKKMNNKKAMVADETLKWILYIAILAAASFGIWKIVGRFT